MNVCVISSVRIRIRIISLIKDTGFRGKLGGGGGRANLILVIKVRGSFYSV